MSPVDAARTDILSSVAVCVAERGIYIMQAIADDPRLAKRPTLTIRRIFNLFWSVENMTPTRQIQI